MPKKRILLVEPDEQTAGIIQDFLQRDTDLQVYIAHSAQAGVHAADEQTPDLVILELAMRRNNGFAFLYEFRSYKDWENTPVIIHSHLAAEEAAQAEGWKNLGAVAYFYKPQTTLADLKFAVQSTLGA